MALDADAEPLTRDDIDGIIAHGDPVERMFLLRRHDLAAGQWLRLPSDGNILVHNRTWDVLRDRVASHVLTWAGFYSRPPRHGSPGGRAGADPTVRTHSRRTEGIRRGRPAAIGAAARSAGQVGSRPVGSG